MKIVFTILATVIFTVSLIAQSPEKMSYQAIIRNSDDNLVTEQQVGMQISILNGSASGTIVYSETQNPTTNTNGLVSIEIGNAAGFDTIDWSMGPYYLKTETDPAGGTNYTITGTSQLLSVPYAMYSKLGGLNIVKLHAEDQLGLEMSTTIGPDVPGSSVNIGDISRFKGLILEWQMDGRPEVFHQFIYLSEYDKDVILGNISTPDNYPRRYTKIISDSFGTMMWLGVSIDGTQLYLSTNSEANPSPKLQRIYGIL